MRGLEWLTDTGDAEWGLRLGAALFRFWETREYLTEGRARLALPKLPPPLLPSSVHGPCRGCAWRAGDHAAADAPVGESLRSRAD